MDKRIMRMAVHDFIIRVVDIYEWHHLILIPHELKIAEDAMIGSTIGEMVSVLNWCE